MAERALIAAVRRARNEQWLRRNAHAMETYNERVEREGPVSQGLRIKRD